MTVPTWPGDHAAVRALWGLRGDVAYLNHGAFGAVPVAVRAEQRRLRAELDAQPFDFLIRAYDERMAALRTAVAAFLRADPAGLAFVDNATTGVATVLASWLRPGDRVVITDHVYPAVALALARAGADVVTVPVDLDADVAAVLLAAVDERTRLVVVDAVTSPTALVFPVAEIVRGCRERGVRCVVDAAHAPGLLDVDLGALDPDWWTGNLHKWCGAPTGTAVLFTRADLRDRTRPLVASHGTGAGYVAEFDWCGTYDPSGRLAAPAGLACYAALGWAAVRAHGRALAAWGAETSGLPRPAPVERHAAMVLLDPGETTYGGACALRDALWRDHRVEVGASGWRGRGWLRVSAAPYNAAADYERLAAALRGTLRR